jgi:hypothetical protein
LKELELFTLDGLGGFFRRNAHSFTPAPGQTCLNCDTPLQGRYCYACGQDADTHHRTIGHLIFEAFEGLFHLDGRIWQTLPPLFFAPGKLARDFMQGRIARHVPPFRIFLVALLVFMLAAEHKAGESQANEGVTRMPPLESIQFGPDGKPLHPEQLPRGVIARQVTLPNGRKDVNITRTIGFNMSESDAQFLSDMVAHSDMKSGWLKTDLLRALNHREAFLHSVFTWGHRLALLLLPIIGLFLGLLYSGKAYRGRLYLYDHLLVSMNLLSFVFLIMAARMLLPEAAQPVAGAVVVLWSLINFYQTLRYGYGSSILGTVIKTGLLWLLTSFAFSLLIALVGFVSLTLG